MPNATGIGHSSRSENAHFLLRDAPCIAKSCDELTSQTGTSHRISLNVVSDSTWKQKEHGTPKPTHAMYNMGAVVHISQRTIA
jgi:hypothetical protein